MAECRRIDSNHIGLDCGCRGDACALDAPRPTSAPLEFDVDEFYDEALNEYRPETLEVPCPDCGFANHPLPGATVAWSGWRWMGVSHLEPCTDYRAACAACNRTINFTVRSPQ